jgi:hypothetical protein
VSKTTEAVLVTLVLALVVGWFVYQQKQAAATLQIADAGGAVLNALISGGID